MSKLGKSLISALQEAKEKGLITLNDNDYENELEEKRDLTPYTFLDYTFLRELEKCDNIERNKYY